ncbi:hypothetical protein K443DRAFT_12558 [Laccaria amethystina LaAM-08-1]|uniref:Uncharacterized protein n=1 Tax=Laccaria amethystina LaAM-08-1 TaxID=1095629 RepID=A0A0C9X881_9AGAR|nr:hypothetical protein K443DRAFT_12558 [Laccaria amethystina LaAM-08-1]
MPHVAKKRRLDYSSLYVKELEQRGSETYSDLCVHKSLYNAYAVLPADLVNPKWEEWLLGKPEGHTLYSSHEASTFDYDIWHLCPRHSNIREDPRHICLVPIIQDGGECALGIGPQDRTLTPSLIEGSSSLIGVGDSSFLAIVESPVV